MPKHTTIRVDPEVWQLLVELRAKLTLERGKDASMNEAVKDLLREADERQQKGERPD